MIGQLIYAFSDVNSSGPSDTRPSVVIISAYTLGQVINDVSEDKYNNDD